MILYILLCGYPPFNGRSDDEIMENVLKAKLNFKFPIFNKISDDAKNLIKLMLTKNFKKRLSAEEVLDNKWF